MVTMAIALRDIAAVTSQQLGALGLPAPDSLADGTIPLWRRSAKAKYHWADSRGGCKHIGAHEPWTSSTRNIEPSDHVPVLSFDVQEHDFCTACARQITLSPAADAFIAVAAELARAAEWMRVGGAVADRGEWTWLQFARWRADQPLQGQRWTDATQLMRGALWAQHALHLRAHIAESKAAAVATVTAVAASIRQDPSRQALLDRAVRMVETDSAALSESDGILRIAGCPPKPADDYYGVVRPPGGYQQPSPWRLVAAVWRRAHERDEPTPIHGLIKTLDESFDHVHDLSRLPSCLDVPITSDESLHSWAARTAKVHRDLTVVEWLSRLDMALDGIRGVAHGASAACTHLAVVDAWPLTREGAEAVAYLAQFDVVCGPITVKDDSYYEWRSFAVLRVPEWAADHISELPRPMRCEPITNEDRQSIELSRRAGAAIVDGEFGRRRKPSRQVEAARADIDAETSRDYHRYGQLRRPLHPDASPPKLWKDEAVWDAHSADRALEPGATFVFGRDRVDLLGLGMPHDVNYGRRARLLVELQTSCPRHDGSPHVCEVDGLLMAVTKSGEISFLANGMGDPVIIPSTYLVALNFTR
jgi:hypothetical protein